MRISRFLINLNIFSLVKKLIANIEAIIKNVEQYRMEFTYSKKLFAIKSMYMALRTTEVTSTREAIKCS